MISVKIHTHKNDIILAACDEDILGQTFTGDGMKITVSELFYGGESVTEDVFVERTKSVSIMNLVGNRVVERAIAEGIVDSDNVIEIGGVKHAQVVIM
ncbi:MAG: DUF424 family protein [Candidatus Methanomethylophilaceae archaeon]|jgi:hypothetical protein